MPNCPICNQILCQTPTGAECDNCRKHYPVSEVVQMPGYNEELASLGAELIAAMLELPFPPGTEFAVYPAPGGFLLRPIFKEGSFF